MTHENSEICILKEKCVLLSHLTLAIDTNVQRVVPAGCAVHHSWSALSVEVVALCQAVQ